MAKKQRYQFYDDSKDDDRPSNGARKEMTPLNVESVDDTVVYKQHNQSYSMGDLLYAFLMYACDAAPRLCWIFGILALLVPIYLIVSASTNHTETFGIILHDYTNIQSDYDLKVGDIDHWCLGGDDNSCRCEDPLQPQSRAEYQRWVHAFRENKQIVDDLVDANREGGAEDVDIAFLGASIIEEMDGRWFGDAEDGMLEDLGTMFQNQFSKRAGAELEGVALGIAGDTTPAVLWRILNGEMADGFNPKIWWLEIGMNDLGRAQCSEEVVILGVLRIVEEIMKKKPDAEIVINSMFPMSDLRGSVAQPLAGDFKDFSTKHHKKNYEQEMLRKELRQRTEAATKAQAEQKRKQEEQKKAAVQEARRKKKEAAKKKQNEANANNTNQNKNPNANDKKEDKKPTGDGGQKRRELNGKDKLVAIDAHKNQQKEHNLITHREHKMPLWTSITSINAELSKFARKQDRVHFFDATYIFTDKIDGKHYALCTDLISIRGHPTPAGFEKWEKEVVVKAKAILDSLE